MLSWLAHLKKRIWQESEALRQANVLIRICLVLGLTIQLFFFAAWQVEPLQIPTRRYETCGMSYLPDVATETVSSARSRSWLKDSEPLFFPTSWNATASYQEEPPAQDPLFPEYPPIFTLQSSTAPEEWEKSLPQPDRWLWNNLSRANYLGQSLLSRPPAPTRPSEPYGTLRLQTFAAEKPLDLFLPAKGLDCPREILWSKAVFSLQVRDGSLVGTPLLLESSQSAAVDASLLAYLANPSVPAGLPDGYYLATFSP